ncbi:MAG: ferredoxin/flavodoxin---NADP+ reductase [Candidatus Sumerlaeota bacterium]|nr:ferredoxin/flavodoxin---NADP+ reductase [Candidatus Sumerlaeota bacterium]
MPRILKIEVLAPKVRRYVVEAPKIARKRKAGQFVLVCATPTGERIPLTISNADPEAGTINLIVQEVGKTTIEMAALKEGDELTDVVGPLGQPTHIAKVGRVVCVGGGIGIAPLFPIIDAMKQAGNDVTVVLGARNEELLILEDEVRALGVELVICTDDGSKGRKGFVTDVLKEMIAQGPPINEVVTIGPAIMMKFVCEVTRPHAISTLVSLNPIMVDGTGMCGGCRVQVGNEAKFACVDGPEFDGHLVDFDLLMRRQQMYKQQEREALERYEADHTCHLEGV